MRRAMRPSLLPVLLTALGGGRPSGMAKAQTPADAPAPPANRQHYPLHCRGGSHLVLDTILPPSDTGRSVGLVLKFVANPTAAGAEGQGLQPGTCAWVDHPVTPEEPLRIRVTIGADDSTPARTVLDSAVYWSFLASNSDSGHLTGVGYRHWDASSPPLPLEHAGQAPASPPAKGRWLPFNPRHLHWYVIAWMTITWVPILTLVALWSGWRRLAGLYPDNNGGRGRSFRSGSLLMKLTNYRAGVRLTADASYLHFAMGLLTRAGHPPFSVPWSDIAATQDEWPWFPLKGKRMIRLTLARYRDLRILLPWSDGDKLIAASEGRLQLTEPPVPVATHG